MDLEKGGSDKEKKEQPGTFSRRDFLKFGLTFLGALALSFCPGCGPMKDNREQKDNPNLFNINLLDPNSMDQNWGPELQEKLKRELPLLHQKIYQELQKIYKNRGKKDHPFGPDTGDHNRDKTQEAINQVISDVDMLWREYKQAEGPMLQTYLWRRYLEAAKYLQMYIDIANAAHHSSETKIAREIYFFVLEKYCKSQRKPPIDCREAEMVGNSPIREHYSLWQSKYLIGENVLPPGLSQFFLPSPGRPYKTALTIYDVIIGQFEWNKWHEAVKQRLEQDGWPEQPPTHLEILAPDKTYSEAIQSIRKIIKELDLEDAFGVILFVQELPYEGAWGQTFGPRSGPDSLVIKVLTSLLNEQRRFLLFTLFHELFHFLYEKSHALSKRDFGYLREKLLLLFIRFNPFASPANIAIAFSPRNEDFRLFGYPRYVAMQQPRILPGVPNQVPPTIEYFREVACRTLGFPNIDTLIAAVKNENQNLDSEQRLVINTIRKKLEEGQLPPSPETITATLLNIGLVMPDTFAQSGRLAQIQQNILNPLALYTIIGTQAFEETLANVFGQVLYRRALRIELPQELQGADKIVDDIIKFLHEKKLAMQPNKNRI